MRVGSSPTTILKRPNCTPRFSSTGRERCTGHGRAAHLLRISISCSRKSNGLMEWQKSGAGRDVSLVLAQSRGGDLGQMRCQNQSAEVVPLTASPSPALGREE